MTLMSRLWPNALWSPHVEGFWMAAVEYVVFEPVDDDWMRRRGLQGSHAPVLPVVRRAPPGRERREATARQVCATCAVQLHLPEFARGNHEYGFWGGESEDERHAAGYRLIAPIGVRARVD